MGKGQEVASFQPTLYEEIARTKPVLKLRELPPDLQPGLRLATLGASALTSAEMIGLILNTGTKSMHAVQLAEQMLISFGGLIGLARASLTDIADFPGVSETQAVQIKAALELGRRLLAGSPDERLQVRTPVDIANLLMLEMSLLEQEELRVVILDTKNYVVKISTLYKGSLNSAVVRIAEVFREPIKMNAAGIVIVHNHPSGDPTPSPDDVRVTEKIVEAGALLDITVLDHLVIGRNRFVSLQERGLGFR